MAAMNRVVLWIMINGAFLILSCVQKVKPTIPREGISAPVPDKAGAMRGNGNNKNPRRTASLFEIEGTYTLKKNGSGCKMILEILNNGSAFSYKLLTDTRELQGTVSLRLNEPGTGYYITLKGIKWSEYEGPLSFDEKGEEIEKYAEPPEGVEGSIYQDAIAIQNTGNSMNYYVQIGECDLKFIHLDKQES